jgi:hypothetical protein
MSRMLLDDAPGAVVLAVAALVGAILALAVLGPGYVAGTSTYWSNPVGDASMTLTGYRYYVSEPWHWPLATTFLTNAPEGANIIYFDAIPLVALPAKLLHPWLPKSFHPYGLWHFGIFVMQGVMGARFARALGARSLLGGLACAVLGLSATVFTTRFYHADLGGQFLLLWALALYAEGARGHVTSGRFARGWIACASCALLVHPYLLAMVGAVAVAAHLHCLRRDARTVFVSAASSTLALAILWCSMGYVFRTPTTAEADAFGQGSLNLLSIVLPYRSAVLGQWFDRVSMDATGLQWDAQGYLGIGGLLAVGVAIATCGRSIVSLTRGHKALAVVTALLFLYSVSPHVFFGRALLASVPWLEHASPVWKTFRGNGRFFWPVSYLVTLGAAVLIMRRFRRRGVLAVTAASMLQLFDARPDYALASSSLAEPWERHADWAFWSRTLPQFHSVALYPSWYCWTEGPFPEHVSRAEREIELLAASSGLSTNHARTGRVLSDCARGTISRSTLGDQPIPAEGLIVLFAPFYTDADAARLARAGTCTKFDDGWACSSRPTR